jgi:hypothetical protein
VATRNEQSAEEAAEAFEADRWFSDPLAMIRDDLIDVVTIAVKVPAHRELVLAALDAGKAVYCEAPLGRHVPETEEMASAARSRHTAVGLQGRVNPSVRRAAEVVSSGGIGQPLTARVVSAVPGFGMDTGAESVRETADHVDILGKTRSGAVFTADINGGVKPRFGFEIRGSEGWLSLTGDHPYGFQAGDLTLTASVAFATPEEAAVSARSGSRKLGGEHVDHLDGRLLGEQVLGMLPQRIGDRAREVRLAAGVVGKGVEDAEGRGPETDSVPGGGGRLSLDQGQAAPQEALHLGLLPGFRLQTHEEGNVHHGLSLPFLSQVCQPTRWTSGLILTPLHVTIHPQVFRAQTDVL